MGYAHVSEIPYAVVEERTFVRRVYGWMTGGLLVTALIAVATASTPALFKTILGNPAVFYGLIIGELVLVGVLSAAVHKMSPFAAGVCFVMYAALNGLTLSVIFIAFELGSIATTFFITAGTFGAMSVYGYVTKRDLTSIGNLCFMALFGIVIGIVVNLFLGSPALHHLISCVGVLVFVGLTAYDTQKIKQMHERGQDGSAADRKAAVMGALALYLDFINLFLMLLYVLGGRRR